MDNIIDIIRKMGEAAKNSGAYANNVVEPMFPNQREQQVKEGIEAVYGNKKTKTNLKKIVEGAGKTSKATRATKTATTAGILNNPNIAKAGNLAGRGLLAEESIGSIVRASTKPDDYYSNRYMVDPEFDRGLEALGGYAGLGSQATFGKAGTAGKIASFIGPEIGRGLQFAKEHPKASMIVDNIWGPAAWQPVQSWMFNRKATTANDLPMGYSLRDLGFKNIPKTEEELAELRRRIAEKAGANINAQPNNAVQNNAVPTNTTGGTIPNTPIEKIATGGTYNGNNNTVNLLPKVEVSPQEEQEDTNEETPQTLDSLPKSLSEIVDINNTPTEQSTENNNSIDALLAGVLKGYDRNTAVTPENLALARLAGGYRRNPYYAQLIDKGANAYRTEAAKIKLMNEYIKQQQADEERTAIAAMLLHENIAKTPEEAMSMASIKGFSPYMAYKGKLAGNEASLERTGLIQDRMDRRQQLQISANKALKELEIDSSMDPELKSTVEVAKVLMSSPNYETQQTGIELLQNAKPEYFKNVGNKSEKKKPSNLVPIEEM